LEALAYPCRNAVIYAQLSVALLEGTAHHVIFPYNKTKNGYRAWQALHQWFDGEDLVYKQSVKYKEKISTMKL
jgi:hypothetical protein